MSEKDPKDMTRAERQAWAMDNMPLSDEDQAPSSKPAAAPRAATPTPQPTVTTRREPKPDGPYIVLVIGYLASVLTAGAALAVSEAGGTLLALPFLVLSAAGVAAMLVGVIAAGVRLGMRWARYEAQ